MGVIVISCKFSCCSKVFIPHCFQNQGRRSEPDIDLDMAVGVLVGTGHLCAYCRTPLLLTTEKKYKSFLCSCHLSCFYAREGTLPGDLVLYIFNAHHFTALHRAEIHRIAPYCPVLYKTMLHYTALKPLHCSKVNRNTLHCTALNYSALQCTALHCTAKHCIAVYYFVLHNSSCWEMGNREVTAMDKYNTGVCKCL